MTGTDIARRGGNSRDENILLDDARIVFRNFSGAEGMFNREGDRNFAVILEPAKAEELLAAGWNVKYLRPREEGDEPTPYLAVTVGYKGRPPVINMMTTRGRTQLDESTVNLLDWADIARSDIVIRPYDWEVSGKTGRKAYLKSLYVTIDEDPLEQRYNSIAMVGDERRMIEDGVAEAMMGGPMLRVESQRVADF